MKSTPLIALDLEIEQPRSDPQTPDSQIESPRIIQMGWVVFTVENGVARPLKEQRRYVNIGVPLSRFIQTLTGVTDAHLRDAGTLFDAYDALVADWRAFEASRLVRQWGYDDMGHLRHELESDIPALLAMATPYDWVFGKTGYNVKHLYHAYALANGLNTRGGLSKCLARCGLRWQGRGKHDALIDAHNTASIYAYLEDRLREPQTPDEAPVAISS